jgi:hypothetical protein
MVAAGDWLDAHRALDIEAFLGCTPTTPSSTAVVGGRKPSRARDALRAYWEDRFRRYPALSQASALGLLQPNVVSPNILFQDRFVASDRKKQPRT